MLFCFAAGSSKTAVQTAEATGHRVGTSYETGSHSSLYTVLWRDAGSIPCFGLLLAQPAPPRLKGTAAQGPAPCCHGSCSNRSSVLRVLQHKLLPELGRAAQHREHWENNHWVPEASGWARMDQEWCSHSTFIGRKKQLSEKLPKTCLYLMYLMSYVIP